MNLLMKWATTVYGRKANYDRIKAEVKIIVESEKQRIASNPQLSHLLNKH